MFSIVAEIHLGDCNRQKGYFVSGIHHKGKVYRILHCKAGFDLKYSVLLEALLQIAK